MSHIRCYIC